MRLDAKCRSHFEPTEAPELGGTRRSCGDGGEAAAAAEPVEPVEFGFGSGSEPGLELGFGSGDDDGTWSWSWKTGQPRRQKRILAREGGGSVWNMTGMGLARGRCGRSRSLETLWLSWRAVKVHWSGQAVLWAWDARAGLGLQKGSQRPSKAGRGEIKQGPRASRKHQCPSSLLRDKKGEDPRVVRARAGGEQGENGWIQGTEDG